MLASKASKRVFSLFSGTNKAISAVSSRAFWSGVEMGPSDPILGLNEAYKADPSPSKINAGMGAYRTDEAQPWVLPSVREAERRVVAAGLDMEYSPIDGCPRFTHQATKLAFGADSPLLGGAKPAAAAGAPPAVASADSRVAALQSLSGTGALRTLADFLHAFPPAGKKLPVLIPKETWGNHFTIFQSAGHATASYRYWDPATKGFDLAGMVADLKAAPKGSAVVLHAVAHNPTGVDPSEEQWAELSEVIKGMGHLPIFDNAYQGFATGDLDKDAFAIRKFVADGHLMAVCQSFAKNFGLYGHRIGNLAVVCADPAERARVLSQLKITARGEYSSPPIHGARIVRTVLEDAALTQQWRGEVKQIADRLVSIRGKLVAELQASGSKLDWSHITKQRGMFAYTGLTKAHVDRLREEYHVYMTANGRMAMTGITSKNVGALAAAIHKVTST